MVSFHSKVWLDFYFCEISLIISLTGWEGEAILTQDSQGSVDQKP